jgi:hypothetical protein
LRSSKKKMPRAHKDEDEHEERENKTADHAQAL